MAEEKIPSVNLKVKAEGGSTIQNVWQEVYLRRPVDKPFQVPPLPAYFVERPEASQAVKSRLLAEATAKAGTLVVSVIYGLGGIGKSTLAAALAYDPKVQEHFPDGVLWATLGQQPDLLSFLSSWIQALGDYDFKPTTSDAASRHLRTLLHDKAALLVVDDVWNSEHVESFQVGGSKCRVLVTTREAIIIGTERYDLDVMSPEQALELLTHPWKGKLTEAEKEQARALAKEVGYLPLALELAAAQVSYGIPWSEILSDLQGEIQIAQLEALDLLGSEEVSHEEKRKKYSLRASFNLSLRRLPPEKLQKFAWLGVLPEDATVTQQMATTLWDCNQRQARETLRYLRSKALLLPGRSRDEKPTYRLHDLIHDLARNLLVEPAIPEEEGKFPGLGLSLSTAHAQLLERYHQKTRDGLWHTLPDDGYIHAYLPWHFEQAHQVNALHELLQEETEIGRNGWYEACDKLGQTANFVTYVSRASQLAEALYQVNPSQSIALQVRSDENLLREALDLARAIEAPDYQALAVAALAPRLLPLSYRKQVLNEAQLPTWQGKGGEWERHRAEILAQVLPRLAEGGYPEKALAEALSIGYENYRSKALAGLAPYLPPDLLHEVLAEALSIGDEKYRAEALAELQITKRLKIEYDHDEEEEGELECEHGIYTNLLRSILNDTNLLDDWEFWIQILQSTVSKLKTLPQVELYPLWRKILLIAQTRQELLIELRVSSSFLLALGGSEAVVETARAIQDIGRWWP